MRPLEALRSALDAISAHKLRSILTLVGIVAGVAAIISVMTGVSVVQSAMEAEISVLGSRTFQVQKYPPGGFGFGHREMERIQRWPPLTVEHVEAIRERVPIVDLVGAELWDWNHLARYRDQSTEPNLILCGGTPEYADNNTHYVELGRNLSDEDVKVARRVAVIGYKVAERLFPFVDPIGKTISLDGNRLTVQGVFSEKTSAVGARFDDYVLIPITLYQRLYGSRDRGGDERSVNITVRALTPEQLDDAIEATSAVLRAERGLGPRDEDNFFFFTNDSQIKAFNQATAGLKAGAFVLGAVALLVAGIGIMNIMLVAVTERTREIGIRKAVGATRGAVLGQFLLEAVLLCNLGGLIGVAVGFGLGNLVAAFTEFAVHVPLFWVLGGVGFCTAVGLVFGMWPALRAANLAPVEALRYE